MSATYVHQAILPDVNWNYNINSSLETTRLWKDHECQLPNNWTVEILGSHVYFRLPAEGFIFYNDHFNKHLEPQKGTWQAQNKRFGVSIFNETEWDNYRDKIKLCLEQGTFTIDLGGKPPPDRTFKKLKNFHGVPAIKDVVIR
jgi:hypothetical protein